jgi:hypothetical protein
MRVRLAADPPDVAACRELIGRVYLERYGVTLSDAAADPDGGAERFPDRYVLGEVDGRMVACAGLYCGTTYVERFGGVDAGDVRAACRQAGLEPAEYADRPFVEYTKIVVDPTRGRRGYGRRFLAASHAAGFLAPAGERLPLVLVCARLTTFRLWEAVGIHTRFLREFPSYRNHARYRSVADPMESRLVIPERDVPTRFLRAELPTWVPEPVLPAALAHEDLERHEGDVPLASMDLVVTAREVRAHWPRCWLTAEFLARAFAPTHSQLTVVIDELLENAVKFCADRAEQVTVRVHRLQNAVMRVEAHNRCDRDHAEDLDACVRRVLRSDPEALFVEQLERSARSAHRDESRMGFVTLCIHAGARLGVRIREARDGLYDVTVSALLPGEGVPA